MPTKLRYFCAAYLRSKQKYSKKRNDLHLNKPFPTILPILQTNFPNGLLFLPDRMIQVNKERTTASINKLDELAETIGLDLEARFPEMKPTVQTNHRSLQPH